MLGLSTSYQSYSWEVTQTLSSSLTLSFWGHLAGLPVLWSVRARPEVHTVFCGLNLQSLGRMQGAAFSVLAT